MLRRPLHPLAMALALVLAGTACDNDGTGPAEPDEFLLFLSTRDGALDPLGRPMADIYRMDGDGSGAINLTGQPAWLYLHMTLSPDGRRVAFARECEVLAMGTDGSGLTHLVRSSPDTGCNAWPRWSPDGTLVAFATNREGRALGHTRGLYDAYVMNADGSNPRNVSHAMGEDLGFNLHVAGWSPGGQVVFVTDGPTGGGQDTRVYLVNPDGTGLRPLFDRTGDHSPAWSPDGSQIAFISERDGPRRLYIMNADGSDVRPLTNHPGDDRLSTTRGGFSFMEFHVDPWSPDGSRIALARLAGGDEWGTLHTVRPDGTQLRRLTTFSADFNGWSPRGTRVALTDRRHPGPPDIYLANADGSGLRNLTQSAANDTDAFWVSH